MTLIDMNDNFENFDDISIKEKWNLFLSELVKLDEQQIYSLVMDYSVLDGFAYAEEQDFFGTKGMRL